MNLAQRLDAEDDGPFPLSVLRRLAIAGSLGPTLAGTFTMPRPVVKLEKKKEGGGGFGGLVSSVAGPAISVVGEVSGAKDAVKTLKAVARGDIKGAIKNGIKVVPAARVTKLGKLGKLTKGLRGGKKADPPPKVEPPPKPPKKPDVPPAPHPVDDHLKDLRPGRSPGVYEVDTPAEMRELFGKMSQGGVPTGRPYPGTHMKLPDGTLVGLRDKSRSGGETIDIKKPTGEKMKVHLP